MFNAIHKFPFVCKGPIATTAIEMPEVFKVRHVEFQFGTPCLWCSVDRDSPMVKRLLYTVYTGAKFEHSDEMHDYIDTISPDDGHSVYHVFLKKQTY